MHIVFVHGWSVRSTETYGSLPARLEKELGLPVDHIYLGKYVSFDDSVTLDDLSLAFDAAVREKALTRFAAITHSTGGPLIRNWVTKFAARPLTLRHLIMLAPANHGSALAQLGKGRLGRIKAFFESIEPGQKVLDWLELGSEEQWDLNRAWLDYEPSHEGLFTYSLAGDSIDSKLYDHLNSYTGEAGSDGVVRVAAANMNFESVRLEQQPNGELASVSWRRTPRSAFRIVPGMAHGGEKMGIMRSIPLEGPHPTLDAILACFRVETESDYLALCDQWRADNRAQQPHTMLVFRVSDTRGELISDYDLLFTAGDDASPDALPKGFFRDRQRNSKHPAKLSYFLDRSKIGDAAIGLKVIARPDSGLVRYREAVIHPSRLEGILQPDETLMVEIVLRREVDRACFVLTKNRLPERISKDPLEQPVLYLPKVSAYQAKRKAS